MIKSAILLVGGKGERLKPYTDKLPKPMVEILGRPILEYQIHWLKHQGVKHFIFSCGYKHEAIKDHFGDGSKWGVKIDYSVENEPLGRGGAFKKALEFIPKDEELIVGCNGDEIIGEDLSKMVEHHISRGAKTTLLLAPLVSNFGIVKLSGDGSTISGFEEKPTIPGYWVSTGVYIFDRGTIELFPEVGDHETQTFPELAKEGKLTGYKAKAEWTTINTVKDLSEAGKVLPKRLPSYMLEGLEL